MNLWSSKRRKYKEKKRRWKKKIWVKIKREANLKVVTPNWKDEESQYKVQVYIQREKVQVLSDLS